MLKDKLGLAKYNYKGYTYEPDEDTKYDGNGEPENVKIYHFVRNINHTDEPARHMDWSPYSTPTVEQFKLWIDLGFPDRITGGPLTTEDLQKIEEMSF